MGEMHWHELYAILKQNSQTFYRLPDNQDVAHKMVIRTIVVA